MKWINNKINSLKSKRKMTSDKKESKFYTRQITLLKEIENEIDRQKKIKTDDFDHWCSYNGIMGDNKDELLSIVKRS